MQTERLYQSLVYYVVFLFSATIKENIAYGSPEATDEDIYTAAKMARIHDFIETLPDGYDSWVGERGITLSGGQKQRVSIARTLLLNPKILVFDDSTSSVDTETEYLIQQALAELLKGRTAFIIAHRIRTIRNADQILVMKDGRIVENRLHFAPLIDERLVALPLGWELGIAALAGGEKDFLLFLLFHDDPIEQLHGGRIGLLSGIET